MEDVLKKIINKKKETIRFYKKEYSQNKIFDDINQFTSNRSNQV